MCSRYLPSVASQLRHLASEGRGPILLAIAAGWGLTIGTRTIYPVLLPDLRVAYGLDLATAGALLTVLFAAYALGQLPGGLFADRIGERKTLVASMVLSGGSVVLIVVAGSPIALFLATAAFGFGVGFYAIARFTAIAKVYPDGYGTAIGITNVAPEIGQAALPPIAGVIAVALGWQFGFGVAIPAFVLVAIALWVTVPVESDDTGSAVDTVSVATARYVAGELKNPPVLLATLVLIVGFSIWQAFTGFYPTYLIEQKGVSPVIASLLFGLYFVSTAIIHPVSGMIYDRLNVRYTAVPIVASVLALAALPFVDHLWLLVAISILLGTLLSFETATESYLVGALPEDVEGTGFGILRTLVFAAGAASPIAFGAAADRGFFDETFLVLAVLTVVLIVLSSRLPLIDN
ncbi:major facilitator superfamily MFS_1 [Halalkaliarchaeum desulfuricum]|uniref:Major facilitator superfamily MFS_1 n=2 Tax=Halalkaliarchaeum desulfuricum TaxID=2055893 RepID=A0A343TMN5_9EURY|nr:major facilitator superfamily MFS_1 [Halalkaliarchaeum desulfuricum]